ncbi:MAG: hypothetical protein KDC45_12905 [Bacteroidetes bacterium]|nr:hypothetical protein [Bacteroidota bacterium]
MTIKNRFPQILVAVVLLAISGCTKSHFMEARPDASDAARKARLEKLDEEFKNLKANEEIILLTTDGTHLGGRFLYYREGLVTLQNGMILRDYELSEIQGFSFPSKFNHKKIMITLMLFVAAYILFEFTRTTS